MKTVRILMMVLSILTLTTLSSAQTQTNSSTTKPKSSEASASGDQSNIIAREQQIIDAIRSRKQDVFQSLVDQNGWVMTPGGAQQVSSVMSQIFNPAMTLTEYRMEEPRVMMIDKNTAVLTYRSFSSGTMNGKTNRRRVTTAQSGSSARASGWRCFTNLLQSRIRKVVRPLKSKTIRVHRHLLRT